MLLRCRTRTLDLSRPRVMGILNVTPDSFSDGGLHLDAERAVSAGLRMVQEGAAILDVGGESTRPGASPVTTEEELRRVVPVIDALAHCADVVLSVDSSNPEVIAAALQAGAHMVNDVRALRAPGALAAAAAADAAVCVMHMAGEPSTMQDDPQYVDVVREVRGFLRSRVDACRAAGIGGDAICIDPGIGFGKTAQHNLALLRGIGSLADLGPPVLIGVSRKSLVGAITGRPAAARDLGSAVLAALCVERGARIVRAHDVSATFDALAVAHAWLQRDHDMNHQDCSRSASDT